MKNTIKNLDNRSHIIAGMICVIILIFIIRLFFLQILTSDYKNFADSNAFFYKTLHPSRGTISDRNGKLLVYNQPTYDLVYIPREVENFDTLEFCRTLNLSVDQFNNRMNDIKDKRLNPGYSSYTIQTFTTQLTVKESSLLQEKLFKFPGFFIQNRTLRQYNYPNAGLILGYVAKVSKKQMDQDPYYARDDYGGKSGVEVSYEKILRGEKGQEILLRDARGRLQGKYEDGKFDKDPVSGKNVILSIDLELQAYGEYLLQNKVGSVVMIEPSTGEVLCMVTSPSYDPSMLLGRNFGRNYMELEQDPLKPLYNRSTQGLYPPGSVFKPSQGLVFLEENVISTSTAYPCAYGYIPLGGRPKCHGHYSPIAIEGAIATSCNAFFCYGLTAMLQNRTKFSDINQSFDRWHEHMNDMGFGHKLGIDMPFEKQGFIPNSKFYSSRNNNWKPANIISIAIGQGEILTTPLQIANFAALVANAGYYYPPHIVKEIQDTPLDEHFTTKKDSKIKREHYLTIAEGMARAVTGGTCRRTNLLPEIEVCGKTGTAENPHGKDHSIFMGFAPRENPKVAISVFIENGGFGAVYAVPIAKLMFQKYLKGEIPDSDKYLEQSIAGSVILPTEYMSWKREKAVASQLQNTSGIISSGILHTN